LVRVTVCAGPVSPTVTAPKLATIGLAVKAPAGIPSPTSETTPGVTPKEVELTVTVPVSIPRLVGVNTTPVVQLAPTASVPAASDAQVFPVKL